MILNQAPLTTKGDTNNEVVTTYKTRAGAHHIRALNQVSPDVLLVHQSKMVGFFIRQGSTDVVEVIPRAVKALFLTDLGRPV